MADERIEYQGQILGTTESGNTKRIKCNDDGTLPVTLPEDLELEVGDVELKYNNQPLSDDNALPVNFKKGEVVLQTGNSSATNYTSLTDATKDFPIDIWKNQLLEVQIDGISHVREIISNTANTLYFDKLPGEGERAVAVIGESFAGQVTVMYKFIGVSGNDFTIDLIDGVGNDVPTTATQNISVIEVTLGTDGSGVVDATATDVAEAINNLDHFHAWMSGMGGTMSAESGIEFTGGTETVVPPSEINYKIKHAGISRGTEATYTYRTLTFNVNPTDGTDFMFGDGEIPTEMEFTDDLDLYAGDKIPVLIGDNASETLENIATAFSGYEGIKSDLLMFMDYGILNIRSNKRGSESWVGFGYDGDEGDYSTTEIQGTDEVTLRSLADAVYGENNQAIKTESSLIGLTDAGLRQPIKAQDDAEGGYALRVITDKVAYDELNDVLKVKHPAGIITSRIPQARIRTNLTIPHSTTVVAIDTDNPVEIISLQMVSNSDGLIRFRVRPKGASTLSRFSFLNADGSEDDIIRADRLRGNTNPLFEITNDFGAGSGGIISFKLDRFICPQGLFIEIVNTSTVSEFTGRVLLHYNQLQLGV